MASIHSGLLDDDRTVSRLHQREKRQAAALKLQAVTKFRMGSWHSRANAFRLVRLPKGMPLPAGLQWAQMDPAAAVAVVDAVTARKACLAMG